MKVSEIKVEIGFKSVMHKWLGFTLVTAGVELPDWLFSVKVDK